MIKIISPAQFNTSLWKNGQGKTTELAISEQSNIDNFNWRLSIATISNDGLFSKFIGYNRQHVVLSGNGILLKHQNLAKEKSEDRLPKPLNFATFAGDNTTFGELINGPITAFNLMYKPTLMHCELQTYPKQATIMLNGADQYFIYSDTADLTLSDITNHKSQLICKQHLIKITNTSLNQYEVSGKQMIIIRMSLN